MIRRTARLVLVAWLLAAGVPRADMAEGLERLPAVLHLHSDMSTGDFSLEQLATMAEKQGIGALLLTENYLLRVEYGLPPFRALTRVAREAPSVLDLGIDRYLARVAEANRANPRVLIVPGVEVLPHYYWTGSPLALEMTVHDTQKNLLVFGLPADALGALPVAGNRIGGFDWSSWLDALPGLLLVPGVYVLTLKRRALRKVGRVLVVVQQRRRLAGSVLCAIAVLALARGWPFAVDPYPAYRELGLTPHQDLIDHVDRQGGVTVWSFPEARDAGERWVGPVRVSWSTPPYPDDLMRTARYTGFGAVYEDTTRIDRPGESWDRLLGQFAAGDRSRPAWAVGESGFHGFTAGKTLGNVRTVFLVQERSERAVLDALKRGRFYAVQREAGSELVLAEFSVRAGGAAGISGDLVQAAAATPIEIAVAVEANGGAARDVRVTLVRNGVVVGAWTGPPPFRTVHRDTYDGSPTFYRLDVRGAGRLLSNPIFVRRS
ncbi:MAG: hypothetical protein ACREK4_13325 [Candidatus Rokuibacteriota bacterium]